MWSLTKHLFYITTFLFSTLIQAQCEEILVWSDEFDGDQLNEDNWSYQLGNGCPELCGWGNNELQYYWNDEDNIRVEDGKLIITAQNENFMGAEYTSARIRSIDKVDFCTGRIEARMKVPEGQGYWPALWALPSEPYYGIWPVSGEIDIMESIGSNVGTVYGTIHYGPIYPENQYIGETYPVTNPNLHEDFHIFELEWTENVLHWYIDGILYSTKTPADLGGNFWPFDRNFHFIINMAVGGWFPGFPTAQTVFPQSLEVDYVRLYQQPEEVLISGRKIAQSQGAETYYCAQIPGTSYNWSVTGDANIVSGQGSSSVDILMGEGDFELSVELVNNECTALVSEDIQVIGADCDGLFHDFEDNFVLYRATSDGAFNPNSSNPLGNEVNSSVECGSYVRNPNVQYDALLMVTDVIGSKELLVNGDQVLAMDVFTSEEVGSSLNIQLENQGLAFGPYPQGRHSIFTAETTSSGEWHTLYFDLVNTPDANFGDNVVNQLTFLFEPNSFDNSVWFFDNLRIVNADCLVNNVTEEAAANVSIVPNPNNGEFSISFDSPEIFRWQVLDAQGKLVGSGSAQGSTTLSLDLKTGMYFVQINGQSSSITKKVIVQ